jgi:hypothetical protein
MTDEQKREICVSDKCGGFPAVRVFWPGREPCLMCVPCAVRAQGVGEAIGCYIHMEPWAPDISTAPTGQREE